MRPNDPRVRPHVGAVRTPPTPAEPTRTLAGVVVFLLAPVAVVAALSAPALAAVFVAGLVAGLVAATGRRDRPSGDRPGCRPGRSAAGC